MQVATDLPAHQSVLCLTSPLQVLLQCNGQSERKFSHCQEITLVKNHLPVISYLPVVQARLLQNWILLCSVSGLGKIMSITESSLLLRLLHAYVVSVCLFLSP